MRRRTTLLQWLMLTAILALPARAQSPHTEHTLLLDEGGTGPPATIEDVAWLAGYWEGEGFGGRFEDVWSAPSAGTMMGMFKVIQGGAPSFYELQLIVEREGSLAWLVKHFSDDFVGWEERSGHVTFPLVRLTDDTAYFSGLTVRRVNADELTMYLVMERESGPVELALTYRRRAPAAGAGPTPTESER